MFQVSTLQALALGYSKSVVTVSELTRHGDIGLGTFEDVNGEMILVGGHCYRADENGEVSEAKGRTGVPFSCVTFFQTDRRLELSGIHSMGQLTRWLNLRIEEDFGLNSMYIVRVDGSFRKLFARSESSYRAHHVTLKDALSETQREFTFEDIRGTLICVYFPDYLDEINASGWHLHFISEDRRKGGHVFDLSLEHGNACFDKISKLEITLPQEPAFDTYSLKGVAKEEITRIEQGDQ